jgi:filamentous hemagglutinin family protein
MNHVYRLVWNSSSHAFVAVSECAKGMGKASKKVGTLLPGVLFAGISAAAMAQQSPAPNGLPTGAQVTAGVASISSTANVLTVNQASTRAAINWQSFSIGSQATVNFVQPSASAITLNRVVGTESSIIAGALNANGQVYLLNSNGVLFTRGASVNTAGLVASTLGLSDADFMAGRAQFQANGSRGSVINLGAITAADGGYVALLGKQVRNEGVITARLGSAVLAAGNKVSLNFNGDSLLGVTVDEAALGALVENKQAIRADGGLVVLTAKAVDSLLANVVNNTGEVRAQSIENKSGRIYLLGEGGKVDVGGTLDASAPATGNGGFIETSGPQVHIADDVAITTRSEHGLNGTWLIDPTDFTITSGSASQTSSGIGANTLQTALGSGNVVIQTSTSGSEAGNIIVDAPLSWSANKLTLEAHHNINVNQTPNATGTASLAFHYGQATSDGAGSTYTVASNAKINIPGANAFTWKKGSMGLVNNLTFNNMLLRMGNGTQASINSAGQLEQPWYHDEARGGGSDGWFKLTYSTYPLNIQVAVGGDGASSWNINGELLGGNGNTAYNSAITSRNLEISKFLEGSGSIVSTVVVGFPTLGDLQVENTYTLAANASYLKTDTVLTNVSAAAQNNVRLWVGTQDDYIATRDSQYKFKGNLTGNGFETITAQDMQAKALKITEYDDGVTGAAVLFYSTSSGADTAIQRCCSFSNVTNIDPRTSNITRGPEDGSYALFIRLADLALGASDGMTWYYAAGPVANLNSIVGAVSSSAGVSSPPPIPAAPTAALQDAINNAVVTSSQPGITRDSAGAPAVIGNRALAESRGQATSFANVVNIPPSVDITFAGGNNLALVSAPSGNEPTQTVSLSEARGMIQPRGTAQGGGSQGEGSGDEDQQHDVRVPVSRNSLAAIVNGGVKLPSKVEQQLFVVKAN